MLRTLPLDTRQMTFLAMRVGPKTDRDSTEQKTNREGVPQWVVEVAVTTKDGSEVVRVTVPGTTPPALAVGDVAQFAGLSAGANVSKNEARFWFSADAVQAVAR